MPVRYLRIVVPAVFFVQTLFAQDIPVLVYSDTTRSIETSPYAAVLKYVDTTLDIQQVMALPDSCFQVLEGGRFNLGERTSPVWLRFLVENKTEEDLYFLSYAAVNLVDMYVVSEGGHLTKYPPGGNLRPFENRALPLPKTNFNLGNSPRTLFVAGQSSQQATFTNYIGTKDAIYSFVRRDERVAFFCCGIYFILAVYNLVIYFNSRDTPFLRYGLFQVGIVFYLFHVTGYGYQYFWRDFPMLNADANFHVAVIVLPACFFSMSFLNTRNVIPYYHFYLKILVAVYSGALLLQPLGFGPLSNTLCQFSILLIYFSLWGAGWLAWFKKQRTARFYLVGWTLYLFSCMIFLLADGGALPQLQAFVFDYHVLHIGATGEACFLSFALADRVREIRQQARDAQQLLLKQSQEYEQLVQQHNHLLEARPATYNDPAEAAKRLETLILSLRTERDLIRKISIPTMEGIILLPMSDIVRIEALGSYAVFYLSSGKKITASRPIGEFEASLPDPPFFRTHKSHIVNLNCVERYIRGEGGSVVLQDGTEIGVSRTAKAELLSRLHIS